MRELIFFTGNDSKFKLAEAVCRPYDIQLIQKAQEVDEIQHDDSSAIAIDKARKAYDIVKEPLVVTDDTWEIPGLNGFPGPYMKAINNWFRPSDFISLTKSLKDRRIFITMYLVYCDGTQAKLFSTTYEGIILKAPKGKSGPVSHKVISMVGDNGLSIAEYYDKGLSHEGREVSSGWREFAKWFQ